MYRLKFFICGLFFLFLNGCGENIVNDPVFNENFQKPTANMQGVHEGNIPLEGVLVDPSMPFVEYYDLSGDIQFTQCVLCPDPIARQLVCLAIKASIRSFDGHSLWFVSETCQDTIAVNEFGCSVRKTFSLVGRKDLELVCRFSVTCEDVILSDRWLEIR